MKVLITGGTGLLGYNLQRHCPSDIEVVSIYHPEEHPLQHNLPFSAQALDVTDYAAFSKLFNEFKPEVIIHTAAQGSLDWCEENMKEAFDINVVSTQNIINFCEQHGAHFIFMSSNAVYDGLHGSYGEEIKPSPVNYYGTMKVDIEKYLKKQKLSYVVLRPNLMYGWPYLGGRDNQVTRVISSLHKRESINVVSDTYFSPLSVFFMVEVVWQVAINKINGVYNIGGKDRMSLFELSELTARIFSLDPSLLTPISHKDTKAAAKRAIDTSFDSSLMLSELKFSPLAVTEGLEEMKVHAPYSILA